MQYCSECGTELVNREEDHRIRRWCPACCHFVYRQLKVGAGALIEQDGKLLLVQRKHEPFCSCWNLPAGYVEADESPEDAVVREVFEETGLHVRVRGLQDVYYFEDDPRGSGILVMYSCDVVGGELSESSESFNPTYFMRENLPGDIAGAGHDQAVRAWGRM